MEIGNFTWQCKYERHFIQLREYITNTQLRRYVTNNVKRNVKIRKLYI